MGNSPASPLARNVRPVGHLDIPGGGQIVVRDGYAYVGHMKPPFGTSIIDVSDPKQPRIAAQIMLADGYSHTHKVRVVGDLMVTNVEQNSRHLLRKGVALPELRARLATALGRAATDAELAAEIGVDAGQIAQLDAARERGYRDGGFKIYDIADKANPREIAYRRTFGFGVHRFDVDDRYAYISTEMEGYLGNILVVYDIGDPARPQEV
ncbi:MAG: RNA polymerase subunit sigma-70, partial [Inquilinus sp.]|nr:RNA polymerase subunit sigma-70 [Inquilinus sp.]